MPAKSMYTPPVANSAIALHEERAQPIAVSSAGSDQPASILRLYCAPRSRRPSAGGVLLLTHLRTAGNPLAGAHHESARQPGVVDGEQGRATGEPVDPGRGASGALPSRLCTNRSARTAIRLPAWLTSSRACGRTLRGCRWTTRGFGGCWNSHPSRPDRPGRNRLRSSTGTPARRTPVRRRRRRWPSSGHCSQPGPTCTRCAGRTPGRPGRGGCRRWQGLPAID